MLTPVGMKSVQQGGKALFSAPKFRLRINISEGSRKMLDLLQKS